MEEGFYWVTRPEGEFWGRSEGAPIVAQYYDGLWWVCGSDTPSKGKGWIVGPRVRIEIEEVK